MHTHKVQKAVRQMRRVTNGRSRSRKQVAELQKENQRVLSRKVTHHNEVFTENQKVIGGVPIYVDVDCRDAVIPRGKQMVERLMTEVNKLDLYAPNDAPNFYVQEVKQARQ